jgi:excisionase family DNA binding protein
MGSAAEKQTPATPAQQEWFTVTEACVYTRVAHRTLQAEIAKGKLKPDSRARPGLGKHRFRRATLDAWLMGVDHGEDDQK